MPARFIWRLAAHGVVPAADKTTGRPLVGLVFKFVAHHVIPITRERDETWFAVLQRIDPQSMIVIAPEGRMKRANGLDLQGKPMSVRGGIADILNAVKEGRMLLAYSGGLHHVQVPGARAAGAALAFSLDPLDRAIAEAGRDRHRKLSVLALRVGRRIAGIRNTRSERRPRYSSTISARLRRRCAREPRTPRTTGLAIRSSRSGGPGTPGSVAERAGRGCRHVSRRPRPRHRLRRRRRDRATWAKTFSRAARHPQAALRA